MSDGPTNSEYQELDSRLRAVEASTMAITTTITNVGQDISELKQMMQAFMAETKKIAELSAKVGNIDRVEKKVEDLDKKTDNLHGTFMAIQAEHSMCQLSKNRSEDYLRDLHNKFTRLETGTLQQLATIQADLSSLKNTHNKVDGVLWQWGQKAGWAMIAALAYVVVQAAPIDAIKSIGKEMIEDHSTSAKERIINE